MSPPRRLAPDSASGSIDRNPLRQLIRYGIVGVASNGVAFGAYLLATALGVSPKASAALIYVVAAMVGFFGNRSLTFEHSGHVGSAGLRYVVAHTGGFVINLLLLVVLVDHQGYSHVWSQAFAIVVVAAYLFAALKYFVFPTPAEGSSS